MSGMEERRRVCVTLGEDREAQRHTAWEERDKNENGGSEDANGRIREEGNLEDGEEWEEEKMVRRETRPG